jgi:adenosylcobinamide-phosphate synthase
MAERDVPHVRPGARIRRGVPFAAVALDLLVGEPPPPLHPTVAMGRLIGAARRRQRTTSSLGACLAGIATIGLGALTTAFVARAISSLADSHVPAGVPSVALDGVLLKPSLSLRALLDAGAQVERALHSGTLSEARRLLAWHLVSRDVSSLTEAEVAGAAIESLAENLSDGLVAPLLAYALGGLPAAYVYRFVNTADAMLGYRTPELEWFGKAAARTDDLLNLLPARMTAALIAAAAPVGSGSPRDAIAVAWRDHARTPSPNAGWPMSSVAGALGVRLTKRDAYDLNKTGRAPNAGDIGRTRRIVVAGAAGAVALGEMLVGMRQRELGIPA